MYTELNLHNNIDAALPGEEATADSDINANINNNPNNNIETKTVEVVIENNDDVMNSNSKIVEVMINDKEDVTNSNINTIQSWCDEALAAGAQNINFSDLDTLSDIINKLKKFITELSTQRSQLEEVGRNIGENSNIYISSQSKLQKINFLLPKKLATLRERKDKLSTMVDSIREKRRFVQDLHNRFDTAKNNEDVNSVKVAIGEIEYSVQKIFNDFSLLEKEVEKNGYKTNSRLQKDLTDLKQKWSKLNTDIKLKQLLHVPASTRSSVIPTTTSNPKDIAKTSSSYSVSSVTSQASAASSVSQTGSEWACRSTNTGTSCDQWATSPTTGTNSPMSEEAEDVPKDELADKTAEILAFIKNLSNEMGTKQVDVMDTDLVGKELDRIRSLISNLDAKKQMKNDLILMSDSSRADAKNEVNTTWSKLYQNLMSRKTELTTMLEHTDNLQSKGKEVSDWLGRLEAMLAGAGVGKTRDTLLKQIRDVNQIHRELQQYAHHVALLSQVYQLSSF